MEQKESMLVFEMVVKRFQQPVFFADRTWFASALQDEPLRRWKEFERAS